MGGNSLRYLITASLIVTQSLAWAVLPANAQDKKPEIIKIATEGAYAPWNFSQPDGKLDGFDVELSKDLCRRMEVRCEIAAQDWDGLIPSLNNGKFDAIMAAMNVTPKRLEAISFSRPYALSSFGWAVLKDSSLANLPGADQIIDLANNPAELEAFIEAAQPIFSGKTVGVQISTVSATFMQTHLPGIEIREYKNYEQAGLDLLAGRIDAIMQSHTTTAGAMQRPEFKDLVIGGPKLMGDLFGTGVAVGLRKDQDTLKAMFDEAITQAVQDGTAARLAEKWFKLNIAPPS